jgi:hypothetical protein
VISCQRSLVWHLLCSEYFKLSYLAGFWQEDFRRSLLWAAPYSHNEYDEAETSRGEPKGQCARLETFGGVKPEIFQAPSWSWAAMNGSVEFLKTNQISTFPSELDASLLGVNRVPDGPFDSKGQTNRVQSSYWRLGR